MSLFLTEAEARVLLRSCGPSPEVIEGWIAEQPWEAAPGGWTITGEMRGWQFRIDEVTRR